MKKIAAVLVFLFCASLAVAHGPDGIRIETDFTKSKLKVFVSHQVKDNMKHFVYEIAIKVNGKKVIDQEAFSQTGMTEQALIYVIPGLKAGDKIEVYAECNKGGDMKKTFTAENTEKKEEKTEKK